MYVFGATLHMPDPSAPPFMRFPHTHLSSSTSSPITPLVPLPFHFSSPASPWKGISCRPGRSLRHSSSPQQIHMSTAFKQKPCVVQIHTGGPPPPPPYPPCSGISDIRAYLNGIHIKNLLSIRTLIAKSFGVSFAIASGLVAGKEVGVWKLRTAMRWQTSNNKVVA